MVRTVGSDNYTYDVMEDWAKVPAGWEMPAAAVALDSQDRVYCFNRDAGHPVMVFNREGEFLTSWGAGQFAFPHAVFVDAQDNVWLVDRNNGQVLKYTADGKLLMTLGEKGYRSDTGVDPSDFGSDGYKRVKRGGGPFNLPAGIFVTPEGEIFIADGYANCQVHHFDAEGKLIRSWGAPGNGPGEFNLPHGVWLDRRGRVLVADRENDRMQVFTREGEWVRTWPAPLIGAALCYVDGDDIAYVPEHNSGMFSILDPEGAVIARWGSPAYRTCHGVWLDSHRDIYVVQPAEGVKGRTVVKYVRR